MAVSTKISESSVLGGIVEENRTLRRIVVASPWGGCSLNREEMLKGCRNHLPKREGETSEWVI